jgi:hypothetical protein
MCGVPTSCFGLLALLTFDTKRTVGVQFINGVSTSGMAALLQLANGSVAPGVREPQPSRSPAPGVQMERSGQPSPPLGQQVGRSSGKCWVSSSGQLWRMLLGLLFSPDASTKLFCKRMCNLVFVIYVPCMQGMPSQPIPSGPFFLQQPDGACLPVFLRKPQQRCEHLLT